MDPLIVFDIDGTLLTDSSRLQRSTLQGLCELKRRRVPFTLASGRLFQSCRSLASRIGVTLPIITCNGAMLQKPDSGALVHSQLLSSDIAREVLNDLEAMDDQKNLYLTMQEVVFVSYATSTISKNRASFPIEVVSDVSKYLTHSPIKITVEVFDRQTIFRIMEDLNEKFGKALHLSMSDDTCIDITASKTNKGEMVKLLANLLGIKSVIAFGNHHNDLEMLRYADIGVAMANAPELVRNTADYVTLSNNEDGIFHALNDLVFQAADRR